MNNTDSIAVAIKRRDGLPAGNRRRVARIGGQISQEYSAVAPPDRDRRAQIGVVVPESIQEEIAAGIPARFGLIVESEFESSDGRGLETVIPECAGGRGYHEIAAGPDIYENIQEAVCQIHFFGFISVSVRAFE